MEYGVVLVMLLAVAFAINSHEDHKYDDLQKQVSALKKSILNMNIELENVRKKYDGIHGELRAVRNTQRNMGSHPIIPSTDVYYRYQTRHKDKRETTQQNQRVTAYTPTLHLSNVWNGSKAVVGPKGDKGDSGSKGVQGIRGTAGNQGQKGDNGNIGTPGSKGQKGDTGRPGITGLQGPKGNMETKPNIVFSANLNVVRYVIKSDAVIVFRSSNINMGNYYDPDQGTFRCGVTGIYLFMWSIVTNESIELAACLEVNGSTMGVVNVNISHQSANSVSNTVLVHLSVGDRVNIRICYLLVDGGGIHSGSSFSGFLLN